MNTIPKYGRTFHLTFSEGSTSDDKRLDNNNHFLGTEVVMTAKIDGSNFCITSDVCFARSHSGPPTHPSFDWAKSFHSQIKYLIPNNLAIYAEYIFAQHSISYENLPHYLAMFNILDLDRNVWLSWDEVELWSQELEIPTAPVLFRGVINTEKELEAMCKSFMKEKEFGVNEREGVVIRLAGEFSDGDFAKSIGKMVRKNHVNTDDHWAHQEIVKNKLKGIL